MTFFGFSNGTDNRLGECTLTSFLRNVPSQDVVEHKMALIILQAILCPFAIFINLVFLKAYYSNYRLHNTSNLLLANLSLSNFFYVSFALPLSICRHVLEIVGIHVCILWDIQQCTFLYLSALSYMALLLISGERFIALFLPFRHPSICNLAKIKRAIVAVWLIMASLMGALHVGAYIFYSMVCVMLVATLVVIAIIHWKIFLEARKKRRNIFAEKLSISQNIPGLVMAKCRKAEKNVGFVIGFMLVCSLPMVVNLVYVTIYGYTLFALYVFCAWSELFLYLNAAGNPFVYCLRNRSIRQAMWNLIFPRN